MSSYFPTFTLLQRVVTMSHERLRSAVAMAEGISFHLNPLSLHNYFRHPFLQSLRSTKQVHNMYFESNVKTKIGKCRMNFMKKPKCGAFTEVQTQ